MAGKSAQPPPLPGETLARVLRVATLDGRVVLILAGIFALAAALNRDGASAIIGVLAAGTGAMTLHAVSRLRVGDSDALPWLGRASLLLLGLVWVYCGLRLAHFDPGLMDAALSPALRQSWREAGLSEEDLSAFFRRVYHFTYGVVAMVALLYQGGLARYYHRRAAAVRLDLHPGAR